VSDRPDKVPTEVVDRRRLLHYFVVCDMEAEVVTHPRLIGRRSADVYVAPELASQVPEGDTVTASTELVPEGFPAVRVRLRVGVCRQCGAVVPAREEAKRHIEWHDWISRSVRRRKG
jgi:hypothetical protein